MIAVTPFFILVLIVGVLVGLKVYRTTRPATKPVAIVCAVTFLLLFGANELGRGSLFTGDSRSERCAGSRGAVGDVNALIDQYFIVIDPAGRPGLTRSEAGAMVPEISALRATIESETPPAALLAVIDNVKRLLAEAELQFSSYADGGLFDPTLLTSLFGKHNELAAEVEAEC